MTRYRRVGELPLSPGYYEPNPGYEYLGVITAASGNGGYNECWDEVGSKSDIHSLDIEHVNFTYGTYSGKDGFAYTAHNCSFGTSEVPTVSRTRPAPSENAQMSHVIASTAPYVPSWNGINALIETKDFRHLPSQLRDIGYKWLDKYGPGAKAKSIADAHLIGTFGFLPFVNDLKSLLKFQDASDKRVSSFKGLTGPQGRSYSRQTDLDTSSLVDYGTRYFSGHYAASEQFRLKLQTVRKSWGSVNWRIPKDHMPPEGSGREKLLAATIANGLWLTPDTLWQALPWTWLIDWFSNIDDFIKISGNVLGASSGQYCLMTTDRTKPIIEHSSNVRVSVFGSSGVTHLRRRGVFTVYPEVHLPFVTAEMGAILTSLTTQRLKF